jgi:hypothetical protein
MMQEFLLKLCLFLFLAALFSGRTNELGVLTGALTGTILLWPLYRRFVPHGLPRPQRKRMLQEDEETEAIQQR